MRKYNPIIVMMLCLFLSINSYADDRIKQIENQLSVLATDMPGLEENVQMSVSGVSIQEFMRGIAEAHKLNISVDPSIQQNIVNNFANATVSDVLLFICKEYNLSINFIGSIMSIVKYIPPQEKLVISPPKVLKISYHSPTNKLSLDLKNDTLDNTIREIAKKSKKNIVIDAGVPTQLVSVYIEDMDFDKALEKLGIANNLLISKTNDDSYLVEKTVLGANNNNTTSGASNNRNTTTKTPNNSAVNSDLSFEVNGFSDISVYGTNVPIEEVIKAIANEIGVNYFLISDIKEKTSINVTSTNFKGLLDNLLQGTETTYSIKEGIYVIGERKTEGLRATKVIQLQHRSVETVNENIPAEIKLGVSIKEFLDLNSLILSGSEPRIFEIEQFIKDIDKVVPVILIEVMIIDYSNSRANSTGIEAGLGTSPATTGGTVFPEPNVSLNSNSINDLIESFNGFGVLNLGKVTPNFYLNIRALETQGILRVKSTPKLATLNGHEATMTIGNTAYYVEETTNTLANQTTQTINTRVYKSVNADLSVTIKPFVSGDDQITLEITVSQSDFTEKIEPGAPPGSVSRNFTSYIRVKNQEMILLGGLEEKSIRESGRGVPFLSRIPVIKWFFSSRSREKSKSKLNVFIKPTVIY